MDYAITSCDAFLTVCAQVEDIRLQNIRVVGHTTGVCLVAAVGLTQDLKLIMSTKKHQTKQNKENKTQARIHLLQQKVKKDSL